MNHFDKKKILKNIWERAPTGTTIEQKKLVKRPSGEPRSGKNQGNSGIFWKIQISCKFLEKSLKVKKTFYRIHCFYVFRRNIY